MLTYSSLKVLNINITDSQLEKKVTWEQKPKRFQTLFLLLQSLL